MSHPIRTHSLCRLRYIAYCKEILQIVAPRCLNYFSQTKKTARARSAPPFARLRSDDAVDHRAGHHPGADETKLRVG